MSKMLQLKQKDLREYRNQQWLLQKKKCAVTGLPLAFEKSVVDHCHKRKNEPIGVDGKGMVRGVIHFKVNSLEGKIANAYKRYGLSEIMPLPELLRCLADYIENPPVQNVIHPSSIPKVKKKKPSKRDIKRVLKFWKEMYPKRKVPTAPTTLTKQWQEYIDKSKEIQNGLSGKSIKTNTKSTKSTKSTKAKTKKTRKRTSKINS